ncbi:MAG: MFS transporter [Faecousia sp.]
MKLNYKRTVFVGFAFFLICAFWQAYDNTIPLILTNKFGLSQTASGAIMALDNVLALFMLPLFGAISDRHNSKLGRRTPFILIGTLVAAIAFVGLSFVDNAQMRNIASVTDIDSPAALEIIYDSEADATLQTPEGEKFVLSDVFTREEFVQITSQLTYEGNSGGEAKQLSYPLEDKFTAEERADSEKHAIGETFTNPHYTDYVVPARQAYAWQQTAENPMTLVFFIALLLLVLVSMAIFRSPAVALMPDVTIKPLRSKANAVINLMGSAGGILVLILGMVFSTSAVKNSMMSYTVYFSVIAGIMVLALALFLWQVREPQFVREMHEESRRYGIDEDDDEDQNGGRKLSGAERRSLCLLLASIVLWYMGYNAVTSKYSVYASNILNKDYNLTLIIAQAAAILSYLPVGMVSSKLGRKKTILGGIVMLTTAFFVACFLRESSSDLLMNCMFALAGIGWATINVNSFPMVVEMCRGGNVGKYTGIYYTASMAAQTVTPLLSGYLMDKMGMTALFPYASVFVALAFGTMLFVMHGDNKPTAKRGLEALDVED